MAKKKKRTRRRRRKIKLTSDRGQAHIKSTFNNTIVTFTDETGNVITWCSAGQVGFKGSRKSTPFAAQKVADQASNEALKIGLKTVEVFVKGPGSGKESAVRAIKAAGLKVTTIQDVSSKPHNGCRLPKRQRL